MKGILAVKISASPIILIYISLWFRVLYQTLVIRNYSSSDPKRKLGEVDLSKIVMSIVKEVDQIKELFFFILVHQLISLLFLYL